MTKEDEAFNEIERQAKQRKESVDGTRKWSAGDDWFYTIEEKNN